MITDTSIREQGYLYFLAEAEELLNTIEQGLFNLSQGYSIAKVHNLMRATHTIKGGAANVGLELIQSIAHSLEDVFKALYNPDLVIDIELQTLLLEAYECLRIPLAAELSKGSVSINQEDATQRAASIFAQLQQKLGDAFGADTYIPTSVELGFDIVQSVFEMGVKQRLESIELEIKKQQNSAELDSFLRSQLEVFIGLAESLSLPGFGAIAQTTLAALEADPAHVHQIAEIALADFLRGREVILGGDRESGGEPSVALQNFIKTDVTESSTLENEISQFYKSTDTSLDAIWGGEIIINDSTEAITVHPESEEESLNLAFDNSTVSVTDEVLADIPKQPENNLPKETRNPSEEAQKNRQPQFVRVDVAELEHLNYLTGELLVYEKRRNLQDQNLKQTVEKLFQRIQKNQITLNRLRDLPLKQQNFASHGKNFGSLKFDSLEMDEYTEFHLTLHEALEQNLQLQETTESLDLLLQQSSQTGEKKHALLLNVIDALVKARMLPLRNIVNRFPQMVQNFASVYGKRVEMKINGTNVLIDKAIAEKLHDPLLHLVRNAFDHGIELPEVRSKFGKPEQGLIEICAYHKGNYTVIEVRDDGPGLNFEKIYNRAIELNLISDAAKANGYLASATQSELLEVLFEPGFSTAAKPSEISGRGIGLDIVRSQLQALNGEVSVKSTPQQGTTFILKIPFSMTTDKLMLVEAGGNVYALLSDSIVKILLPKPEQIKQFEGKRILHWNTGKEERMVSVRKLSDLVCYSRSSFIHHIQNYPTSLDELGKKIPPVLLLRHNQEFLALEVDHIIGEQELVIRPLGNALAKPTEGIAPPKYIYGCSSLANGTLILVIDTAVLLDSIGVPNINMLSTSYSFNNQPLLVSSGESSSSVNNSTKWESNNKIQLASSSKLLLVVDDALSLRQTITLTLQKSGYQVVQAIDGLDAIEKLQQNPEIQLVISDLEMPRMNGFEFLSHVRQASNSATIPVVILTSRSSDKHQHFARELGANAYLTKPYLEDNLLGTVENLIQSY